MSRGDRFKHHRQRANSSTGFDVELNQDRLSAPLQPKKKKHRLPTADDVPATHI